MSALGSSTDIPRCPRHVRFTPVIEPWFSDHNDTVQALRSQAYIRRFFRWCIERDILKADPTMGLPREQVLCDVELAKVMAATNSIGVFGPVVRLLALTGMRREEASQLRWFEIDGDQITLEGNRTKTGAPHIIPLSAPAKALLAGMPRIAGCDYVFTSDGKKPVAAGSQAKRKLDAASGVSDWVIHDLRRTVATGMQKLGVSLQTVEACLGREALESWGALVAGL
jgi:integrase